MDIPLNVTVKIHGKRGSKATQVQDVGKLEMTLTAKVSRLSKFWMFFVGSAKMFSMAMKELIA